MESPAKFGWMKERNCILVLIIILMALAVWVATVPYNPSADLADATTNDIWVEHYDDGIYHIPYDEWAYPPTQSVVVEYQGELVVVNEKGPGHVMLILPFRFMGAEIMFGPFMAGLAVIGSYMLGKRLLGWKTGFIAGLLVLVNLTVIVMWHRYYWTDASTMHLLVLSVWLFVEGIYLYNGSNLDPRNSIQAPARMKLLALGVMALSGLAFGASVSTRYPTGLLVVIFPIYLVGFHLIRAWPNIRGKQIKKALNGSLPVIYLLGAFAIGLLVILIPLMNYNATYFGGPLNSGYDATSLMEFGRTGTINVRNATATWAANIGSYIFTAFANLAKLMPTFISRMPVLIFLMPGIYAMRKKRLELALLLTWASINAFTYLSLSWVDMYVRPDLMPWEPRYWMPSLPAVAIIGGYGIIGLSDWMSEKLADNYKLPRCDTRLLKAAISLSVVGILVLWSAAPAVNYLRDPPPAMGGHQQSHAVLVTTEMLLLHPQDYLERAVLLNDAIVTGASYNSITVQSWNATQPGSVTVRFIEWPAGELPDFHLGQHVSVRGMFNRAPAPPGVLPSYLVGVKYGTLDFVRILN